MYKFELNFYNYVSVCPVYEKSENVPWIGGLSKRKD